MAKINLNDLPFEEALRHVRKWQKNRYKNGINSWGNSDPFIHERNMKVKFIVELELATKIIDYFMSLNNKYTPYVEHFV